MLQYVVRKKHSLVHNLGAFLLTRICTARSLTGGPCTLSTLPTPEGAAKCLALVTSSLLLVLMLACETEPVAPGVRPTPPTVEGATVAVTAPTQSQADTSTPVAETAQADATTTDEEPATERDPATLVPALTPSPAAIPSPPATPTTAATAVTVPTPSSPTARPTPALIPTPTAVPSPIPIPSATSTPAPARSVRDLSWVQAGGLSTLHQESLGLLGAIERKHPEALLALLEFPWLDDGITPGERLLLCHVAMTEDSVRALAIARTTSPTDALPACSSTGQDGSAQQTAPTPESGFLTCAPVQTAATGTKPSQFASSSVRMDHMLPDSGFADFRSFGLSWAEDGLTDVELEAVSLLRAMEIIRLDLLAAVLNSPWWPTA